MASTVRPRGHQHDLKASGKLSNGMTQDSQDGFEISPFTTSLVALQFSTGAPLLVHRAFLEQHSLLALLCITNSVASPITSPALSPSQGPRSLSRTASYFSSQQPNSASNPLSPGASGYVINFADISPQAGHVLVQYLYSPDKYHTLRYTGWPVIPERQLTVSRFQTAVEVYGAAKKYELRGLEQLAKKEMLELGGRLDAFTVIGVLEQQPTDSEDKWLDEFVKGWARKAFQDPGRVLRAQEEDETQGQQETPQGMALARKFMRGLLEVYEEMNSTKKHDTNEPADDFATAATTQVESLGLEEPLPQPAEVEITKETFSIATETKHVDFNDNSTAPATATPVQQHEHTIYRPVTPPPRFESPRHEFHEQDQVKELEADQWVSPATSPSLEAALGLQPAEYNELPTDGAVELSPKFSHDFSIERDSHHEPDRESILEPEPEVEEPVMIPLDAVVDDDISEEKAEGKQEHEQDTPPHVEHIEHSEPEIAHKQETEYKELELQLEHNEPEIKEPEAETKEEEAFSTPMETLRTPMEGLVYTSAQKELERPVTPQPRESVQTPPEGLRTPQNGLNSESFAEDSPASVTASPSSPSKSRKKNLKRKAKLAEAKKRASATLSPVMSVASSDATPFEIPARDIASPEPLSLEASKDKPAKGIWNWTPSYDEGKDWNKSLTFSTSEGNKGQLGSTGVLGAPVEIISGGVDLPEATIKNTAFEDELTRESDQAHQGPYDSETPKSQMSAFDQAKRVLKSMKERPQTPVQPVSEGHTPGEQAPIDELTTSPKSPKKKRKARKKTINPAEESTALVQAGSTTQAAETPAETPQETPQETATQPVLSRPGPAKPTKKKTNRDRKDSKLSPEPTEILAPPTSSPSSPDIRSSLQSPPQSPPQPAYKIFWPWGSSKQANQPKDEPLSLDQALAPAPKSEQKKPEPETTPEPLALEGQSDAPTEPASSPKKKKTTKRKKSSSKIASGGGASVVEPEPETQPQPRESEAAPETAAAQARPEVTQQDEPKDDKDNTNTEDMAQVAQPGRDEMQPEVQPVVEHHAVQPTIEEQQSEAQPEPTVVDQDQLSYDLVPPIEIQTHIISPTGAIIDTLPTIPEDITPSASTINFANPSLTDSVTDTLSNSVAFTAVEYQNSTATLPLPVDVGAVGGVHELAADRPIEAHATTVGKAPGADEVELVGEEPETPGGGALLVDAHDVVSKPVEPVSESQSKPSKIPLPSAKADDTPPGQQTPSEGGWGSWLGVRKNKKKAADKDKTADKDKSKKDDVKKTLTSKASKASIKGLSTATSGPSAEPLPPAISTSAVQPNPEAAQSKTQLTSTEPTTESQSPAVAATAAEPDQLTQRALNSVKSDPELRPSTSSSTTTNDAAIQALSQSQTSTGKSGGWGFPLGKKRRNTSAAHGPAPPVVAAATPAAAAVPKAIPEAVTSTVGGPEIAGSQGSGSGNGNWSATGWLFPGVGGKDGKDGKETHGNGDGAGKGGDASGDDDGKVNGDGEQVDVKGVSEEEQDKQVADNAIEVGAKDEDGMDKANNSTERVKEAITNEASVIASAADEALDKALNAVSSVTSSIKDAVNNAVSTGSDTVTDPSTLPAEPAEPTEPASTEVASEQPPAVPPTAVTKPVSASGPFITTTSNTIPGEGAEQFFLDQQPDGSNTQVQTPSAPIESPGDGSNPDAQITNVSILPALSTQPSLAAFPAASAADGNANANGAKGESKGKTDVSVATIAEVQGETQEPSPAETPDAGKGLWSGGKGDGKDGGKDGAKGQEQQAPSKPKAKTRSDSWSLWGMSGRSKRNSVSSS
ncbi:hypothetical protein NEUTE1DRAFT_77984 [Neurospora tetrasperma FGSC 2508]|uniref:BTB domain-containing protein n=1 Tax=Neurospora tetrasperma (strain FGSC 2508 / ATCC MYA-4615 / P0657) TaxID=510951 RepID=F8MGC0_NEUT8|nr:uncharacterized protein NEUTE1DRAFT_77984 [Neurospora tetrasperma FGSC 2508]EGO58595.1 hypothetical protein NEUTE1DRAFT_77984 [Neurospora tetrasperma FGSC 2508]EGZ72668.1 hypothetical protein NEUTE2DRAFT_106537 [Neurospora tetrasperma FGSC 2509]